MGACADHGGPTFRGLCKPIAVMRVTYAIVTYVALLQAGLSIDDVRSFLRHSVRRQTMRSVGSACDGQW